MSPLSPSAHVDVDECLIVHSETLEPHVCCNLSNHFLVAALQLDIEGVTFKVCGSRSASDLGIVIGAAVCGR